MWVWILKILLEDGGSNQISPQGCWGTGSGHYNQFFSPKSRKQKESDIVFHGYDLHLVLRALTTVIQFSQKNGQARPWHTGPSTCFSSTSHRVGGTDPGVPASFSPGLTIQGLKERQDSSVSLAGEAASGVADVTRAPALAPGIALSLQQDLEGENGHREFIPKSALIAL